MPKRPDFTNDRAESGKQTGLTVIPPPRMNLNGLDGVRRELARVYRDMRGRKIDTQDGYRLAMVLGELRKLFEACDLEKSIAALEGGGDGDTGGA